MTTGGRGPDVGSYPCGFLVERKDNTVRDERLEIPHLAFQRLSVSDRKAISAQALEHGNRGDRQPPEVSQVGQRAFTNVTIPSAQLRQSVGIKYGRLVAHPGSAFPFHKLSGKQIAFRRRNVSETGDGQRKNARRRRSDINVLSVMSAEQGDDLSLETPAAPLRVRCNSLAKRNRDANGARNRRWLGNGSVTHNQNSTRLVLEVGSVIIPP